MLDRVPQRGGDPDAVLSILRYNATVSAPVPVPTPIFHMTHVGNLAAILAAGGLSCDRAVCDQKLACVDIGNAEIKADRYKVTIDCGPRGVVADYVPFYFAPRSPMLYKIHKDGAASYLGGQNDVLYLVGTAQSIASANLGFAFTNGHARMAISQSFDDLRKLRAVDWDVMASRYWHDTQDHPDRKWRRQAEFLVHSFCPINQIDFIGARTNEVAGHVKSVVESAGFDLNVRVMFHWCF